MSTRTPLVRVDPVDAAIIALLTKLSGSWTTIEWGDLTQADESAFDALLVARLIEARCDVEVSHPDLSGHRIVRIRVCGPATNVDLRNALRGGYPAEWAAHVARGDLRCRFGEYTAARLTIAGTEASAGVAAGMGSIVAQRIQRPDLCPGYDQPPQIGIESDRFERAEEKASAQTIAAAQAVASVGDILVKPEFRVVLCPTPEPATPNAPRRRRSTWSALYSMLDDENEPENAKEFIARYNRKWAGKQYGKKATQTYGRIEDATHLSKLIADWRRR